MLSSQIKARTSKKNPYSSSVKQSPGTKKNAATNRKTFQEIAKKKILVEASP